MPHQDRWLEDVYRQLSLHIFQIRKDIRQPGYDTGWRSLPATLIEMPIGGQWMLHLKGRSQPIEVRDYEVMVIPSGTFHRLQNRGSAPMKTCFLFGAFSCMSYLDLFHIFRVPTTLPREAGVKLAPLISTMDRLFMRPQTSIEDLSKVHELAFRALGIILQYRHQAEHDLPKTELERIGKVLDLIHQNPEIEQTCEALAAKTNLSASWFRTVFKKATGFAPKIYQRNLRLKQSITLLISTPLPINQIADQCRFHSPYYFTRYFTKHVGSSPSQFRKNFSKSDPLRVVSN